MAPGNNGLPLNDGGVDIQNTFVEGFWSLTRANSLSSADYDVDITGNGFTTFPIVDATRVLTRANGTVPWSADGTHVAGSGNTASRSNISILSSHLALADTTTCTIPVTGAISGDNAVCTGTTNSAYNVTNTPGSTYTWSVSGGTITSAQGLNFVFVDWGSTGMIGYVEVVEDNGCSQGAPVRLDVYINPIPTSAITGNTAVSAGATGEAYSVIETAGYTYTWSITGDGTISSGQGTARVSVDWGAAGTALLSVIAGNGCGNAPPVDLTVDIYDVFITAQSGDWENPATWIGNVVPSASNSARIAPTHTVQQTANVTIQTLIIDEGAILDSRNNYIYINGNYTLNGEHTGGNMDHRVRLNGLGTTIDGTGTYTHLGTLYIGTGDKIVAATADLTIQDNFRINDNIRVTNYGSIIITGPAGIWGDNTGMTWVNETNATLNSGGARIFNNGGSGTLVASATGNTVEYSRTNVMTVNTPVGSTYHNLVISGTNIKTVQANLNITGDLTISSTLNANNLDIRLAGGWTNTGFFTEGTGTVTLDGNADQTITNPLGETYYDLVINKGAGTAILGGNVTVSNSLALTNGIVATGSNVLTLGTGAASIGSFTRTNGWVFGQMERWLNSTGTDYDIPVGSGTEYRPAQVNFNVLGSNGSLITSFISSSPGNDGLPLTEAALDINNTFSEGYWSMIKANSLESNDYNLALTGNGFTSFAITDETRLLTRPTGMTDWTLSGIHIAAVGNTAARDNISILSGEYAFGDTTNCIAPVTSPISGSSQRCINNAGIPYFVTDNPGSTYTWQITGGMVASGQGTSSITVDWGSTAMMGQVLVIENNGCTDGSPEVLEVEIGPLPTSAITGPIAVANGESGVSYSVDAIAGYTYNWTVSPEGSIATGLLPDRGQML